MPLFRLSGKYHFTHKHIICIYYKSLNKEWGAAQFCSVQRSAAFLVRARMYIADNCSFLCLNNNLQLGIMHCVSHNNITRSMTIKILYTDICYYCKSFILCQYVRDFVKRINCIIIYYIQGC